LAWPVLALLHAWQVPPQAVLQQNPSTQVPLVHWFGAVHAVPLTSFATQALLPLQ
jgi:EamA domain-containing membrane protein RarD